MRLFDLRCDSSRVLAVVRSRINLRTRAKVELLVDAVRSGASDPKAAEVSL